MTPDRPTADEYAYDLSAAAAVRRDVEPLLARPDPRRRWRDIQVVAAAVPPSSDTGRGLISRRSSATQRLYERAIWVEGETPGDADFDLVICAGCQVLEEEVGTLIGVPLRPHAAQLAAAFAAGGDRRDADRADGLRRWGGGEWQTTLGVVSMALTALRRGLNSGAEELGAAAGVFTDRFVATLRAKTVVGTLDQIREKFRNPVAHRERRGEPQYRPFTAAEYDTFARRLVGAPRLGEWEENGPVTAPPPDEQGFLHHLLTGSRLVPDVELPPAGGAVDRLTALARPRPGALAVEVLPRSGARTRLREIAVEAVREEPEFRLGGEIAFQVRAARDCSVTLIDIGTGGGVSALLPNAWCRSPRLVGGRSVYFPGPEFGDFALRLSGKPGRERVIALVTAGPLPDDVLPPPGNGFARLTPADLGAIARWVGKQPAGSWGAAACEFTIAE